MLYKCQSRLIKCRSRFDTRSPRSGKEIKAQAYIRGYTVCCLCQLVKYVNLTKCCSYQCMNNFMYSYSDVVLIWTCLKLIWTEVNCSCNRTKNCSYVYNLSIWVTSCAVYSKYSNLIIEQQVTECLATKYLLQTLCTSWFLFVDIQCKPSWCFLICTYHIWLQFDIQVVEFHSL